MKKSDLFKNAPQALIDLSSYAALEWAKVNAKHYPTGSDAATFGVVVAAAFNACLNGLISEGPIDSDSDTPESVLSEAGQKIQQMLLEKGCSATPLQPNQAGG